MEIIKIVGLLNLAGGVWLTQDAICSVMYYLGHDDEKWYFNHAVRIFRGLIGVMFIVIGVIILI